MKEAFVKPTIQVIELEAESIIAESELSVKELETDSTPLAPRLDLNQVEENMF